MTPRLSPLALLLAALGALSPATADDAPPKPLTGQFRLAGGRLVEYETHYSRNAIRAIVRYGEGLIVATRSGILQRFDSLSTGPARERVGVRGLACLARGEGDAIFAGFDDGRVCRLDPETLELTEVTKLPGEVLWLGWSQAQRAGKTGGLLAATSRDEIIQVDGKDEERRISAIHDLASGKAFSPEYEPSAFLVDRAGRLWLGVDRGEWGGWVARIDLTEGKVETLPPPPSPDPDRKASWEDVLGFIELADGQIWAFGGSDHMGIATAVITRVDEAAPRVVFAIQNPQDVWGGPEPDPNLPEMPLTHVLEEGDGLIVFSYDDVFQVDKAFKSWRKVATLDLDYEWGRRDAVGASPTVNAALPPLHKGEPRVFATNLNGVFLLDKAKAVPLAAPGQLVAPSVSEIRNTTEGLLFLSDDGRGIAWRLGEKGWEAIQLAPPYEIDPDGEAAPLEKMAEAWAETKVLARPDGSILTVSGTGEALGTRTTARRVGGRSEILDRRTSNLEPSACFLAPDGGLWNAQKHLRRFANGRWSMVGRVPQPQVHYPLRIASTAAPWLFLDRENESWADPESGLLWRLDPGAPGGAPKLSLVLNEKADSRLVPRAAIPWPGGTLLTTDEGFQIHNAETRRFAKLDLDAPAETVTAMARDGLGRLWLGCVEGLRIVDVGSAKSESLDPAPGVGGNRIDCLAADPARADGVIAVINSEAVVFIRVEREP